jgi:hypothetical protein
MVASDATQVQEEPSNGCNGDRLNLRSRSICGI